MYKHTHDDHDDIHDPENLEVGGSDVRNTVFIIPLGAPIPAELADVVLPSAANLYMRLAPITEPLTAEFGFVPIAGTELIQLERVWRTFQNTPKIAVLRDLPGATYDIVFIQGTQQVGLRSVSWPTVSEAIGQRVRTVQRTQDKEPWALGGPSAVQKPKRRLGGSDIADADRALPRAPVDTDEDS